jgi:hypothetical protein
MSHPIVERIEEALAVKGAGAVSGMATLVAESSAPGTASSPPDRG